MQFETFQMVDRIAALDLEARTIRADAQVPIKNSIFEGHFPGYPLLPGVLMIETMAQTGGWLILALLRFDRMALLAQVREAKMRSFVVPGQRLEATALLMHDGSGYAVVEGTLSTEGRKVAEAELRYRVAPFPNETLRVEMLQMARRIALPDACFAGT